MRKFMTSKYLSFLPREDGWAVYHTLFGNLSIVDAVGKRFIEAFTAAATVDEAGAAVPEKSSSALRSYANNLIINSFLVPAGTDESAIVEQYERARERRLGTGYLMRALQLVTVNSCNYKCTYCFMDYQDPERSDSREPSTAQPMGPDVAEKSMREAIALMRRNNNDYLNVEFFGGEPLLNWPVIEHVLNTFGNLHDGIRILYSVTTNGSLITEDMARALRAHNVTVTISVDIPQKISGLRLVVAKTGDRISRSLATLQECGNTVTFNSVISKETIDHVDGRRLIDFAKKFSVKTVGLILDLDLAFYRDPDRRTRALEILLDTHEYGRELGVEVTGYWHQIFAQIAGRRPISLHSGYKTCPATGCKMSVEPDGSLFTCKCTSNPLGTVNDLAGAIGSDKYAEYAMLAYRHAPECAGCEIEGFCSGVCMGSFENEFGRRDMIETGACDMFRKITRDLISATPAGEIKSLRLESYESC